MFVVCIYCVCFVFGLCVDWFYGFVLRKGIHAWREFGSNRNRSNRLPVT